MKRVEAKLSLQVVAPLLDVIKQSADSLKTHLAVSASATDAASASDGDEEMAALWRDSLLETQNAGVDALLALFDSRFFKTGVVTFDAANAAQIIRACSAVRLGVREKFLKLFSDEALERGVSDLEKYPQSVRQAMMCFIFLAALQEMIIEHLGAEL